MTTDRLPRTHIRVVRSDGREWPNILTAYRELLGTAHEIGYSQHQRMRAAIRNGAAVRDQHGFTWKSIGGTVAVSSIAWSDFTFGVELELLSPMSVNVGDLLYRAGFSSWQIVHDGSLSAESGFNAREAISPVLQGEAGLTALRTVCALLKTAGCRVNVSCGMHVHVGVRGMKPLRLRKIAAAFLNAEHHFDALVPASRRANRYCQSNTAIANVAALAAATTVQQIAVAMNRGYENVHYTSYRYRKLNFQSFLRHGTIEFRQHGGTVESDKACAWVRLVTGFCAAAASAAEEAPNASESFEQFTARCTDEAGVVWANARRVKFAAAARRAA